MIYINDHHIVIIPTGAVASGSLAGEITAKLPAGAVRSGL